MEKPSIFSLKEEGTIWTKYDSFSSVNELIKGRSYVNEKGEEEFFTGYWVEVDNILIR